MFAALLVFLGGLCFAGPATFEELFRAGLVALQKNELGAAESNLQMAAKLAPKNGRVWVALAQVYWKLHQGSEAEAAASKASSLASNDPAVLQSLLIYYSESSPMPQSAERAAALYFQAAQPLLQRGQFADAIAVLGTAKTKLGEHPQIELALGVAYYGLRRFDEAAAAFLETIALAPGTEQPYMFLGKMLDQIPNRLPEVTKRFAEYQAAHPSNYAGYLLHAKALDAQSIEPETSRKLLEKAIAMNSGDASAHFELGVVLDRMQLFSEAAGEFEHAAAIDPSDAATHYRLSRVYARLGKLEAAAAERGRHAQLIQAQDALR